MESCQSHVKHNTPSNMNDDEPETAPNYNFAFAAADIPVLSRLEGFPNFGNVQERIQGMANLRERAGNLCNLGVGQNVPSFLELKRELPVLCEVEKYVQGLGDYSSIGISKDMRDLKTSFEKNEMLDEFYTSVSTFEDLGNNSDIPNIDQTFPSLKVLENIPDFNSFGKDITNSCLQDARMYFPALGDLTSNVGNLNDFKSNLSQVDDAVESLTGISPADLIMSKMPGSDLFGFGDDSSDDSNDFESVMSDLRSLGGDVAAIISDSKQFFTQLGALVGVFGTLINTGSNAIDDYHNGKIAASVLNTILLVSIQIPTISGMLFVFLKDKVKLSFKGFHKVREDLTELVDDLESLICSDDEKEDDSDDNSSKDDELSERAEDDLSQSDKVDCVISSMVVKTKLPSLKFNPSSLNQERAIVESSMKRKSDPVETVDREAGIKKKKRKRRSKKRGNSEKENGVYDEKFNQISCDPNDEKFNQISCDANTNGQFHSPNKFSPLNCAHMLQQSPNKSSPLKFLQKSQSPVTVSLIPDESTHKLQSPTSHLPVKSAHKLRFSDKSSRVKSTHKPQPPVSLSPVKSTHKPQPSVGLSPVKSTHKPQPPVSLSPVKSTHKPQPPVSLSPVKSTHKPQPPVGLSPVKSTHKPQPSVSLSPVKSTHKPQPPVSLSPVKSTHKPQPSVSLSPVKSTHKPQPPVGLSPVKSTHKPQPPVGLSPVKSTHKPQPSVSLSPVKSTHKPQPPVGLSPVKSTHKPQPPVGLSPVKSTHKPQPSVSHRLMSTRERRSSNSSLIEKSTDKIIHDTGSHL